MGAVALASAASIFAFTMRHATSTLRCTGGVGKIDIANAAGGCSKGPTAALVGNYVRGVVAITYNRIGPAAYQRGEVRGLPLTLGVFRDALRCLAPNSDARTVRWFKADAASVPALLPLPERPNNALSELFADDATDVATGVKAAPIAR